MKPRRVVRRRAIKSWNRRPTPEVLKRYIDAISAAYGVDTPQEPNLPEPYVSPSDEEYWQTSRIGIDEFTSELDLSVFDKIDYTPFEIDGNTMPGSEPPTNSEFE